MDRHPSVLGATGKSVLVIVTLTCIWVIPCSAMKKQVPDKGKTQKAPHDTPYCAADILQPDDHGITPMSRLSLMQRAAPAVPAGYATTSVNIRIWEWLRACILPTADDKPNRVPPRITGDRQDPDGPATILLQEIIATTLDRLDLWPHHDKEMPTFEPYQIDKTPHTNRFAERPALQRILLAHRQSRTSKSLPLRKSWDGSP